MTHQCAVCPKSFDFVSKLRRHQLTHSGLKPFTCYVCLKSFRQSAHLKGHLRRHAASSEVSLLLSRIVRSEIPGGGDLGGKAVGFGEEARNECEPENDESNQPTDGADAVTGEGQVGDVGPGDYEKSFPNSPNSDCTNVSAVRRLGDVPVTEDKHKPDTVMDEKTKTSAGHQCNFCLKCFSVPSKLRRHVLIHSGLRPFCCPFCPKAFRQLTHLKGHLTTHYAPHRPPGPLKTPEWTEDSAELNETGARCPVPDDLRSVESFIPAEDRTRGKVGHECPVCRKCFSAPSKLRRHVLIHTGQRPFQCSLCFRAFRQRSHLKAHHGVHAADGRRSFLQTQSTPGLKCPVHVSLARKFKAAKQKLKMSAALCSRLPAPGIRIPENMSEAGQVRFSAVQKINRRSDHSCPVCSKNFSAPSKLGRHVLIHTGQRPFSCSICSRGFRQKSHLKIHKCKGGGRGSDPDSSRSTGSIRAENSCGFSPSFTSQSTPEDSNLTPLPHQPTTRPPYGANQSKELGIQCTVCFKVFDFPSKLSRHLLIHMDVKPFKCDICSKSFRQLCHLQNHAKVHSVKHHKNPRETSIPESPGDTGNFSREAEELPVARSPDVYTDSQNTKLDDDSSLLHSINMEEFIPHVESTGLQARIHKGEDFSSEMKRLENQCIFCLKTFNFPSKLSRHLLVHTGIRPYRCQVCSKSFKQLSHLQNHQWVHSREDNDELKAVVNSQGLMDSGGDAQSREADLHSESFEKDHDGLPVHQQTRCPDSNHDERKIKSESDLLLLQSFFPALKHDSLSSGSDRSPTCLEQTAENLKNTEFKHRTGEVLPPAADGTAKSPVWNGVQSIESEDPTHFVQTIEMAHVNGLSICMPEDSFQSSPTVPDSLKPESNPQLKDPHQHLTEPPNDLPICPSCSRCFESLQELHAHVCPAGCPEQRLLKSYQCAVCFKGFEAPSKLKRHYVIHTGQRPYRCNRCDKDYTQSSHLKKHMLSHS